jgi:hypothetical protein
MSITPPGGYRHATSLGAPPGRSPVGGARASLSSSSPLALPALPASPDGAAAQGLVVCAITARVSDAERVEGPFAGVYQGQFSGPARVQMAAETFGRDVLKASAGMPDWAIVIAPGVLRMAGTNDMQHPYWANPWALEPRQSHGDRQRKVRGEVMSWTRKSRAKMTLTLASLDWSYLEGATGLPAMLTLTYPGDWLPVAPSGQAVKAHLRAFLLRWKRAWGESLTAAWKLEFQARGAPHVHIGPVVIPLGRAGDWRRGRRRSSRVVAGDGLPFHKWLSAAWADIVAHPDPGERERHERAGTGVDYTEGLRCADPKRLAIYFSKHGSRRDKEYQNTVPDEWREQGKGPGRFWGYWNIKPCRAVVGLGQAEHLQVSRALRHMSERARVWNPELRRVEIVPAVREVTVYRRRVDPRTGEVSVRRRKVRRRVRRLKSHRGFVCVNDAPKLAAELARLVVSP